MHAYFIVLHQTDVTKYMKGIFAAFIANVHRQCMTAVAVQVNLPCNCDVVHFVKCIVVSC